MHYSKVKNDDTFKAKACAVTNFLAASTNDNTAITGVTIDCIGYESAKIVIPFQVTLASGETLTLKQLGYQQGDYGGAFETAVQLVTDIVLSTGASGGSTNTGEYEYTFNISGKKRLIRIITKLDASASATDTGRYATCLVLTGADKQKAI